MQSLMDPAITTSLSLKCEEIVKYFCIGQLSYGSLENPITRYICIGATGLFIVKMAFTRDEILEPAIPYASIECLIEDSRLPTEMLLQLNEKRVCLFVFTIIFPARSFFKAGFYSNKL